MSQVSFKISIGCTFRVNPLRVNRLPFDFLLSVPSLGTFKSLQLERHHVAKKSCFSLLQLL